MKMYKLFNDLIDSAFGLRIQPSSEARLQSTRMKSLEDLKCDTVIDVGANTGKWAMNLRKSGFVGRIISYEPTSAFEELETCVNRDPLWSAKNIALSNEVGEMQINLASNDNLSSSLLKPKEILDQHFGIKFESKNKVRANRLDLENISSQNIYLKVDTQGYDFFVIQGAEGILDRISVIEFESALIELYDGERLHYEIAQWLLDRNYCPAQIVATHWDKNLATVSIDAIFTRHDKSTK
jgi:FkbM family methyltransferase